jgi:hypothetical protein
MYIKPFGLFKKYKKKYIRVTLIFKKTKNTVPKILSISNKKILSVHKYLKSFFK